MADLDTVGELARQLGLALGPLANDLSTDERALDFLEHLGWEFDTPPPEVVALGPVANDILEIVIQDEIDDVDGLLIAVAGAVAAIADLEHSPNLPDDFKQEFPRQLFDFLVVEYLFGAQPAWAFFLRAIGIIRFEPKTEADLPPTREPFTRAVFALEDIKPLLTDPLGYLKTSYAWDTSAFDGQRLLDSVDGLLDAWGFNVRESPIAKEIVAQLNSGALPSAISRTTAIHLLLFEDDLADDSAAGVGLFLLPETANDRPGFALLPFASSVLTDEIDVSTTLSFKFETEVDLTSPVGVFVRPGRDVQFLAGLDTGAPPPIAGSVAVKVTLAEPLEPTVILGTPGASRVEFAGVSTTGALRLAGDKREVAVELQLVGGKIVIDPSKDGDGFITSMISSGATMPLDLGIGFSTTRGVYLLGSGSFEITIPAHISIGPLEVQTVTIAARPSGSNLPVNVTSSITANLSVLKATIDGLGFAANISLPSDKKGNLGPVDVRLGFVPPTGIGIVVNSGPVSGGGFISFDPDAGRYSGALELSIYSIAVKAFGLIETKVPGGGFSFVIVISAEFTPIQLGLGFTLNGVGGLVGINRTVDGNALANLVRAGASEELLFPKNLVANAPAIIRDLGAVFPARQGHYVFGPLAKIGWGTPTLIEAEIGIFLEFPGPVLSLLGEVKCNLPKPNAPLVKFNLSISGQLDFPHQSFSLDASLHDSVINGFPVSGQMALRLRWGEQSNFALSIGGFHPAYTPPPDFPKLAPMAIDLSRSSSVHITISGFFAITSNTLQIGGQVALHAGGSGISLDANLSVKALFIFSPFSFVANIDASVKISFHGHGPSVHLSATLTGPSPWRVKGEVCVSILFWDACLRFDQTFGGSEQVTVPEIDPWLGSADPGADPVQGLRDALQDPKNWTALPPAGAFATVSLGDNSKTFVDPLGGFSVRQKAVPVETKVPITRFGAAKAAELNRTGPITFKLLSSGLQTVPADPTRDVPLVRSGDVQDQFAGAQFFQMNDAKKLSAPSFEKYDAGYSLASNGNNLRLGKAAPRAVDVDTLIVAADGTTSDGGVYHTPAAHIEGLATKSAVALFGAARGGTRKYVDAQLTSPFLLPAQRFVLANTADLKLATGGPDPATRTEILILLDDAIATDPGKREELQIVPQHELAA